MVVYFFYTFSLPKKDENRICVNIQNKDGKEMNISRDKRQYRKSEHTGVYVSKQLSFKR
jgi:hypothetical protein